jgi:xanthine dehydrogenase/oxidase
LKLDNGKITEKPRIVYGGINPDFVHATLTEKYLENLSDLGNPQVLQKAFDILEKEVNPDYKPPEAIPEYRRFLTQTLLYKVMSLLAKCMQKLFQIKTF